jgi:Transposase DDE domain
MFANVDAALRRVHAELARVLGAEQINHVCREVNHRFRRRLLDPVTTIHLFVLQILHGNCAIARLKDFTDKAFSEAAYCKARMRLPLAVLRGLLAGAGRAFQPAVDDHGRWRGHRTFHLDGSSFSMPDTPELQKAFGQPGVQRAGCGFPVAHILTLFHAGTGLLIEVLASPLRTHDLSQAARLHPQLRGGDVLVGDRAFGSFAHFALLAARAVHGLFRAHQRQVISFVENRPHNESGKRRVKGLPTSRWLKRLGVKDQLVEYVKPKERPGWLDATVWSGLADTVTVRELEYRVTRRGCRTRTITLTTTLLDPAAYPAEELAELYGRRWQIETNLRHLKQTMKMDVLHCETEAGVLKELTTFALVYNLVRAVLHAAAVRQQVPVERLSFADALGWLTHTTPGTALRDIKVNPDRPDRVEPRAVKRRPKQYDRLMKPRAELRAALLAAGEQGES